jgi:hypothetical protein
MRLQRILDCEAEKQKQRDAVIVTKAARSLQ